MRTCVNCNREVVWFFETHIDGSPASEGHWQHKDGYIYCDGPELRRHPAGTMRRAKV